MGKSHFHKSAAWKRTHRGIVYHSQLEKECAVLLLAREAAGEISGLEMQPHFFFPIDGEPLRTYTGKQKMKYIADFLYDEDGQTYIIDAKERPTKDFKIKWALVKHIYPNLKFLLWSGKKGFHAC